MSKSSATVTRFYQFGENLIRVCIVLSIVLSNLAILNSPVSAAGNETVKIVAETAETVSSEEIKEVPDIDKPGNWLDRLKTQIRGWLDIAASGKDQYTDHTIDISDVDECEIDYYMDESGYVAELIILDGDSCRLPYDDYNLTNLSVAGTLYLESENYYDNYGPNEFYFYSYSSRINVTGSAEVTETGMIIADGLGYGSGDGPGSPSIGNSLTLPGGGAYGGYGGNGGNDDNPGGMPYFGNLIYPGDTELYAGSGGGGPDGGAGGGIIYLYVDGTLTIDGVISTNGENGTNYVGDMYSGGGAGGSIYIYATTIAGAGLVSANGGYSAEFCETNTCGAGGSGGRILVEANSWNNFTGEIQAFGGYDGAAGTIIKKSLPSGHIKLYVDNNNAWKKSTTITPDVFNQINEVHLIRGGQLSIPRTNQMGVLAT